MTRVRGVLAEVGGFGIAVAAISIACSFAVIVALPDPPATRMSVDDAAAALRGAEVAGLATSVGDPPAGTRAALVEAALAQSLAVRPDRVRAIWVDPPHGPPHGPPPAPPPHLIGRAIPPPEMMLVRRAGATPMVFAADALPAGVARMIAVTPQPAFIAAVQRPDGRWRSVSPTHDLLSGWRLRVLTALLACLLLIAPVTWLFARRLTRPFRQLVDRPEAADVARLANGPREVRAAAATIAAMRDRLADETRERTRMLAAMAHDLRTPLTGLRLRAETAPAAARDRMVDDIARMEGMIAEVLAFARDGSGWRRPVAVRPVLTAIVAEARERGATIDLFAADDSVILADPARFRRAVENLVQNAIDHAGGGRVTLTVGDTMIVVAVIDRGPGIPAEERARLIMPFERGERSRNRRTGGTGLGLSIVDEFAARHGGAFTLGTNGDGGTTATLSLPHLPSAIDDQTATVSSAG